MGQMLVRFEVEGKLSWKVGQTPNGNWVGVCPALNLTLEGETFQELQESIGEGIQLFFEEMLETGELDAFLRQHKWRPKTPVNSLPKDNVRFDVPWASEEVQGRGRIAEFACSN